MLFFCRSTIKLRTLYAHLFIWHHCVVKISDMWHHFKITFHLSCRTFKICKYESIFGNCLKVIHTWAIQHVKFHTFAVLTINRISIFYATKREVESFILFVRWAQTTFFTYQLIKLRSCHIFVCFSFGWITEKNGQFLSEVAYISMLHWHICWVILWKPDSIEKMYITG